MFYFDFQGFIECYGLPAVIISVIVAIVSIVLDLVFKDKFFTIKNYLPFLIAVALMFLYDIIFGSVFTTPTEITSAGVLCGSVSTGIFAFFKRIRCGKTNLNIDPKILLIEGILSGIIEDKNIESISKSALEIFDLEKSETLKIKLDELLILNAKSDISKEKIQATSDLIINVLSENSK